MNLKLDWLEEYDGLFQNQEARQLLNNPLLQKDIWQTIEDLGLKVNQHQKVLTIDFARIEQDWLKLLTKLYVLVRSSRKLSAAYIRNDVHYLNRFSQFLQEKSVFSPDQIDNQLFEQYDYYLKSLKLSPRSISLHYMTLINFFNLCRQEHGWKSIPIGSKGNIKTLLPKMTTLSTSLKKFGSS